MEESKQGMTPPQTTPAGTFSVKIENTTYVVGVHFSRTAKGWQSVLFGTNCQPCHLCCPVVM